MGDMADDHREMAEAYHMNIASAVREMSKGEVVEALLEIFNKDGYETDKFSMVVRSIIKQLGAGGEISDRQENVLRIHLYKNYELYDPYVNS